MKKICSLTAVGLLSCALLMSATGCGGAFSDPDITIKAVPVSEAVDISDELFGVFLEDINYASQAMDDNIVANGNFESLSSNYQIGEYDKYWMSLTGADLSIADEGGIFRDHTAYNNGLLKRYVNPHYAKVTVSAAGGGIANLGYQAVPMAAKQGETFRFSAFINAGAAGGKMTVTLTDGGAIVGSAAIDLKTGDEWIKYSAELVASVDASQNVRLEITFDSPGTYLADAVALETEDSTAGVKNYIYDAIKELSPKFMRFPGGCIIEGDTSNGGADCVEIYDWKNSVGAVQNGEEAGDDTIPAFTYKTCENGVEGEATTYGEWATRTNNYDLWGYNMDYGLGFYEFFLLAESVGATPLPILNCGLSDQGGAVAAEFRGKQLNGRHGERIADYIADAEDLIAFANGSVSSSDEHEKTWAQLRAQMGHPEPFHVKYLGIGNEQFGIYYSYYEQFIEAFKEAKRDNPALYGDVELIVGNSMSFGDCENAPGSTNTANQSARAYRNAGKIDRISEYGIVDHHYYMGYADFLHFATPEDCIYEDYSRDEETGYRVFVGEYSANNATRYYSPSTQLNIEKNAWICALSEAAYMTALERNGDVVKLAAYAPMFGAVENRYNQWAVDMMYYTNTRLLRSANYYVQQLFMNHSGTHSLRAVFSAEKGFDLLCNIDNLPFDKFYQSVTYDEGTGDIIVKLVNVWDTPIRVNIDLAGASVRGKAEGVKLVGKSVDDVNTLDEEKIKPETFTLNVSSNFGYEAPALSVTAIRIHTK